MRTFVRTGLLGALALVVATVFGPFTPSTSQAALSKRLYIPIAYRGASADGSVTCPSTGQSYDTIPTDGRYSGAPPPQSPDLNLAVRGWTGSNAPLTLVDYNGGTDPAAPQLYSLFSDNRTPAFVAGYKVYDWNWTTNTKGAPLNNWPVTLLGMGTSAGEQLHLPRRNGPDIYQGTYYALVVYADRTRISLHYARNDYIAPGYGIHVENVCVDPNLLAKYQQADAAGRGSLPALKNWQVFGTALGGEVDVAIRDTGTFMDPRSRKDWWQGRAATGVTAAETSSLDHTTPNNGAYAPPGVAINAP